MLLCRSGLGYWRARSLCSQWAIIWAHAGRKFGFNADGNFWARFWPNYLRTIYCLKLPSCFVQKYRFGPCIYSQLSGPTSETPANVRDKKLVCLLIHMCDWPLGMEESKILAFCMVINTYMPLNFCFYVLSAWRTHFQFHTKRFLHPVGLKLYWNPFFLHPSY